MPVQNYIINCIPKFVFTSLIYNKKSCNFNYMYLNSSPSYLLKLITFLFLHHNFQNKLFSDIVTADFPDKINRFNIVYNILSVLYHQRIFINVWIHELGNVPSIISFFPSASWYERESWDLFGVHFSNNLDLRRILTDYGFQGHPLRKDFPLSGFIELYYNTKIDSIIYREINLVQAHRNYVLSTPWDYVNLNNI